MPNPDWLGCRVHNRLNLEFDDELRHNWTISGRDENTPGQGEPHELVRLALAILENLPDDQRNGQALDIETIYRNLPEPAAGNLEEVLHLAHRRDTLTPDQRRFIAGALLAAGTHMLQEMAHETWTVTREPPFPFRMEVMEQDHAGSHNAGPSQRQQPRQDDHTREDNHTGEDLQETPGTGGHRQDPATGRCTRPGHRAEASPQPASRHGDQEPASN